MYRTYSGSRARRALAVMLGTAAACQAPYQAAAHSADAGPAEMANGSGSNPGRSNGSCPAPRGWAKHPEGRAAPIEPVKNRIALDRNGTTFWNGYPIDPALLRQFVQITAHMNPVPLALVEVDPNAPCDKVSEVVALMEASLQCARLCLYRVVAWRPGPPSSPPPAPPPPPRPPGPKAS